MYLYLYLYLINDEELKILSVGCTRICMYYLRGALGLVLGSYHFLIVTMVMH